MRRLLLVRTEDDDHAVLKRVCHGLKVLGTTFCVRVVQHERPPGLGEHGGDVGERGLVSSSARTERGGHAEGLQRVDRVVGSGAEVLRALLVRVDAAAAFVTLRVVMARRRVTLVRSHRHGGRVGFHDVHFHAPLASDVIGVAVEVPGPTTDGLLVRTDRGHLSHVERGVAGAADGVRWISREVHRVRQRLAEQLELVCKEARRDRGAAAGVREVGACAVLHRHAAPICRHTRRIAAGYRDVPLGTLARQRDFDGARAGRRRRGAESGHGKRGADDSAHGGAGGHGTAPVNVPTRSQRAKRWELVRSRSRAARTGFKASGSMQPTRGHTIILYSSSGDCIDSIVNVLSEYFLADRLSCTRQHSGLHARMQGAIPSHWKSLSWLPTSWTA